MTAVDNSTASPEQQQPIALLAGLFGGFASVILTFGFLWPVAPLFPATFAAVAAVIPFKHHSQVARGAFYACLGVLAFEAVFVPILLWR